MGDGASHASIVDNIARLIIGNVGVAAQLVEAQFVHIQFRYAMSIGGEESEGRGRKAFNLEQLLRRMKAPQLLTIGHHTARIIAAYAWHALQEGGVGCVKGDMLAHLQLYRIFY